MKRHRPASLRYLAVAAVALGWPALCWAHHNGSHPTLREILVALSLPVALALALGLLSICRRSRPRPAAARTVPR